MIQEKNPLISVIVPLYNKEPWVERCISSILAQTYQNLEILVVNDGSTDNSRNVVASIEDPRIRVIDKENGGVSSARNKGIEVSKGEYIAFIDADDEWNLKHLEVMIEGFERYPEATMIANKFEVQGHYRASDFKKNKDSLDVQYYSINYLELLARSIFPIHICSTIFKKSIIDTQGLKFYDHIKIGEDINFLIKNSLIGQCIISDYTGHIYNRDDENSAMNKKVQKASLTPLYLYDINIKKCKKEDHNSIRKFLAREYYKKAYQNRGLPLRKEELFTQVGGDRMQIGRIHVLLYFVIRYCPKFVFDLNRMVRSKLK